MIRVRQGKVTRMLSQQSDVAEVMVTVDGLEQRAVNYQHLTGKINVGDRVVLNTTAVYKNLGTGGSHFVMANIDAKGIDVTEEGHIMKLRYTPGQMKVLAVEEEDSPYAQLMRDITSLEGMPVVAATLHSMLAPITSALYSMGKGKWKVTYVMTDGAALPMPFSKMVRVLKEKGLIHNTITCGHAFGGDYEAVNIYSGLLAAKAVANADVAVVAMGPGIVGTGSKYGYTGLEQGQVVNAVHTLGGRCIAVPRISFADPRARHRGISHHTLTALGNVALARCTVALPHLEAHQSKLVEEQLITSGIVDKHHIVRVDAHTALQEMIDSGIKVTTMGRSVDQDREFFLSASAAGVLTAQILHGL